MSSPHVLVLGAGFAGLSAAAHLAAGGARVTLVERHEEVGGRARCWSEGGFHFDMGPSWYWMPDLFERFFRSFGREVGEFYQLVRLDPSYRVVWEGGEDRGRAGAPPTSSPAWDLPAGLPALRELFEEVEEGGGEALERFLGEARHIYEAAFSDYLFRPSLTLGEFLDPRLAKELFRLRMLRSMASHARRFFRDERLARLVEWPVLFLGASAKETPAMYSLMSYADMGLGTWYPMGGMHRIAQGMAELARGLGVEFRMEERVEEILVEGGRAVGLRSTRGTLRGDAVLASADYHHVENALLSPEYRQHSPEWWERRVMSPSSLLFYLGIEGGVGDLPHHTLFFDAPLDPHMDRVYRHPGWPEAPLFYLCAPSVTDPSVAPAGCSNLFLLIPLAAGLKDSDLERERLFEEVMIRVEGHLGLPLRQRILVKRSYAMRDFEADYGAFKGNAYGMANTLLQTGPFKPKLRSRRVRGLYFAGQLTVPGPGMPPSLVSGELSARLLLRDLGRG